MLFEALLQTGEISGHVEWKPSFNRRLNNKVDSRGETGSAATGFSATFRIAEYVGTNQNGGKTYLDSIRNLMLWNEK